MHNQVYLYNDDPDIKKMTMDELYVCFADCIFQIQGCGKYTIRYVAEVLIRREYSKQNQKAIDVIIEVEYPRNYEYLRFADKLMPLKDLPFYDFCIYQKNILALHNVEI